MRWVGSEWSWAWQGYTAADAGQGKVDAAYWDPSSAKLSSELYSYSERPGYRVRSIVQDEAKFNGALSRYLVRGFAERVLRGWRGKFFPPTSPSDSQAYISQCHLTWWGGVPCAPVIELLLAEKLSPFVFGDLLSELCVLQQF